jgi:hypothetical protein
MAKRTYYKGGRIEIWQGADQSYCTQAIYKDHEILTKAGYASPKLAKAAAKQAIDKAVEFSNHVFRIF